MKELLIIFRFAIVGIVATAVHISVVWLLIVSVESTPVVANCIAFLVAFIFSFSGHYYWTFTKKAARRQAIKRFFLISGSAFLLNNIVLVGLLRSEQLSPVLATISAVFVIPAITFVFSRVWAFQE